MSPDEMTELYRLYISVALNRGRCAESAQAARWWGKVALTLDDEMRGRVHSFNLTV